MTVELVVFSGLPASGKTTFYLERFAASHRLVSKDDWPNARRREARQRRLVIEHLSLGRSVVVDNTNPSPDERLPLVAIAHSAGVRAVSYAFASTVEASVARNSSRLGRARIPEVGIYAAASRLRKVRLDEGFDRRFLVRIGDRGFGDGGFLVEDLDLESSEDCEFPYLESRGSAEVSGIRLESGPGRHAAHAAAEGDDMEKQG